MSWSWQENEFDILEILFKQELDEKIDNTLMSAR